MSKQAERPPIRFRRRRGLIPQAAIRRLVREIAERFQPEKIILFGSYAYGKPHADSDVDILVVMPAGNELNQAVRICSTVPVSRIARKRPSASSASSATFSWSRPWLSERKLPERSSVHLTGRPSLRAACNMQ